jgi:predicted lipid carrier protein YhbT
MTTTDDSATGTVDTAAAFFEALGRRGHEPLLGKVTGRVRFDVEDRDRADSWLVTIQRGDVTVSHAAGDADCTMRGDRALLDAVASGRANAMSAVLRGALQCAGDVELFLAVQRVFPGPPRERPSEETGEGGAR